MDASLFDINENLIQVKNYEVLGKLPDPFVFNDGHRMTDPAEWPARRAEMYKTVIELQYGTQPPKPEYFRVDKTYDDSYRITAGTKEKQLSFMMRIVRRDRKTQEIQIPVVDGDFCFNYAFNDKWLAPFQDNNIAYVTFNRTELANDVKHEGLRQGPLYDIYPEYTFGALGAWAWGYSRCVDALEQLGKFDMSALAFTGHSRGGKTAMLAGVLDERAKIVNPNETNAGSCSCYRIHMSAINEFGDEKRSEQLSDIFKNFPYWFGQGMGDYKDREDDLPFDCHFLKAMVAPRILLLGEAASDIWTNPVGSWQTSRAAEEVFDFLGCKGNFRWYFRRGLHAHKPEDVEMLVENILNFKYGKPLSDRYYKTPFVQPELIFDWKKP